MSGELRYGAGRSRGRRGAAGALFLALLPFLGCAASPPPVLEALRTLESRTPVVLIPGITGTRLRDPESGRLLWGNGRSVFLPRDGGRSLALRIGSDPHGESRLVPDGPVRAIRVLGVLRFEFYASLIRLLESNGYRLGDLEAPEPGDSFFIFDYDWRYDNPRASRKLASRLEALRTVRGEEVLKVHLLCQSNAGRLGRYFLKYGGATLEEAEAGGLDPRRRIEVDKLILVGTDNGGAFSTFKDLHRGRSYLPVLGRNFRPEVTFTFASLYESLPLLRRDLFFDAGGQRLELDLSDAESWRRYGWSVFRPKVRRRLQRPSAQSTYGTEAEREAYLRRALDRAHRLHRLLRQDVETFGRTRYYMVQNDALDTVDGGLLLKRKEGWHTVPAAGRHVQEDAALRSLAMAPGDGHATVESQMTLSPQEQAALVSPPVYVAAPHRRIILHPETHRAILEFLLAGAGPAKAPASPPP